MKAGEGLAEQLTEHRGQRSTVLNNIHPALFLDLQISILTVSPISLASLPPVPKTTRLDAAGKRTRREYPNTHIEK